MNYTQQALQVIVNKYSVVPYAGTVVGIEVLNEPNGNAISLYLQIQKDITDSSEIIRNYYKFATGLIEKANGQMLFIIHDAFQSIFSWSSFSSPDYPNAVLDTHHYEGSVLSERY